MSNNSQLKDTLKMLEDYRDELQLQISLITAGGEVSDKLDEAWKNCAEALKDDAKKAINDAVANLLKDEKKTMDEAEQDFVDCERTLKIRQAIKICSSNGEVYWMWKLQPGEKKPESARSV